MGELRSLIWPSAWGGGAPGRGRGAPPPRGDSPRRRDHRRSAVHRWRARGRDRDRARTRRSARDPIRETDRRARWPSGGRIRALSRNRKVARGPFAPRPLDARVRQGTRSRKMSTLPATTDVVIVGAGPTGLALACILAAKRVSFVLIDRLAERANTSRAAVVHARTLEVLEELEVTDRLCSQGHIVPRFTLRDRD